MWVQQGYKVFIFFPNNKISRIIVFPDTVSLICPNLLPNLIFDSSKFESPNFTFISWHLPAQS